MTKRKRPDWDSYWMGVVEAISKRSTCLRHNFGSVIVKEKSIVSTGFNGAPHGLPHCLDIGCLRDKLKIKSGTMLEMCRGVHAEANAIIRGDILRMKGGTMYVNAKPCKYCARMIANSGVIRVVYVDDYPETEGIELLKQAGIECDVFSIEEPEKG